MLPRYSGRPAPQQSTMIKHALFVRLAAKPGKEKDVVRLLQASLGLAQKESTTPVWFALQLGPSSFGIFDAFADDAAREAHLTGRAHGRWGQARPSCWRRCRRSNASTCLAPNCPPSLARSGCEAADSHEVKQTQA